MARLLRLRNQDDISLHAPQDTGNPTVAITSPYAADPPATTAWHKASNENHITQILDREGGVHIH